MVQREGCWVKQTERWPSRVSEELGFCTKAAPVWAQDRLARLVQECVAQADYRWQNRALASWTRGEPIPPQESDEKIAKTCMSEASAALGLERDKAALESRLADVNQDRATLRDVTEKDREFLKQSNGEMVSALGEAAKKPAPAAVATATSTGTAKTESDLRTEQQPVAPPPATTVVELNGVPVPVAPASKPANPCVAARKPVLRKAAKGARSADEPNCAQPLTPPVKPDEAKAPAAPCEGCAPAPRASDIRADALRRLP
jgi:hypothetical protein